MSPNSIIVILYSHLIYTDSQLEINIISETVPRKRLDKYLACDSFGFATSGYDKMAWSMLLFGCGSHATSVNTLASLLVNVINNILMSVTYLSFKVKFILHYLKFFTIY